MRMATWLLFGACVVLSVCVSGSAATVSGTTPPPFWPVPKTVTGCDDGTHRNAASVTARVVGGTVGPVLKAAVDRYNVIFLKALTSGSLAKATNTTTSEPAFTVTISLSSYAEPRVDPGTDASYSFDLTSSSTDIPLKAATIYGAMAGMETVSQMLSGTGIVVSACSVVDEPAYAYRGLLVDSGRRFIPVPLLHDLLDSMSYSKMNVMHLHLSDWAAFRLELDSFPELTAHLDGQFYSKSDVEELLVYAQQRGIAIVPEVDVPSHCGGLSPLISRGLQYCDAAHTLLYNDPANNNTLKVLTQLITAVSAVFPGTVFHLGGDEAKPTGTCDWESIHQLDRRLQQAVEALDRQPVVWNGVYSNPPDSLPNGALSTKTIIQNWHNSGSASTTAAGYPSLVSTYQQLYLDQECCTLAESVGIVTPEATRGKYCFWFPIDQGVSPSDEHLLLGAAAAMWTDMYCAPPHCPQAGPWAQWYDSAFDAQFSESFANLIWPRAAGAAGSMWNYDASLDQTSSAFNALMVAHNARLSFRGATTCPTGCACDWNSKCGKPYGVTPKNPMAVTLINNSTKKLSVKQAYPCMKTYGDKLAQLSPGEKYVASVDFIVVTSGASGDPFDLWFGGGAGWRANQQTLSMTIQGSYIAYNVVEK